MKHPNAAHALLLAASLLFACSSSEHSHEHGHEHEHEHEHDGHDGDVGHAEDHDESPGHDDEVGHEEASHQETNVPSLYSASVQALDSGDANLGDYEGKVTLVVNVASECGLTPQYAGLQTLHTELEDRGFAVLGFPSNEFGGQEPGTAEEIRAFCTDNFGVSFPMFAKIETQAGEGQSPIYARLGEMTGELPSWNFGKYVVSKDGSRARYFSPKVGPDSEELRAAIEEELGG